MSRAVECKSCGCLIDEDEDHDCPAEDEVDFGWTAADEWASWMFPGAYLPRFEDLPKVSWSEARFGKPLHERIQEYIDQVNPQQAAPREAWRPDLRVSTPGDAGEYWAGRITDFTVTVDNDLETHDDLTDAVRMYLAGQQYDLKTEAAEEVTRRTAALEQNERPDIDWEEAAEEMKDHGPDRPDVIHIHPSVFPGDSRTLAEAEALVGMHPKHETLEELPGPCIMCGEDEVYVSVRRDVDGEIVWSKLTCQDCGWEVTTDEDEPGLDGEVPRYCPGCGEDHVRVTLTFRDGEVEEMQLQCSECELGQQ